jgi:type III secretion protein L
MGLAVLIDRQTLRVAHHGKVVKREDFAALLSAQELTRKAEDAAQTLLAHARQRYEQERAQGYRDGLAQAQAEFAASLLAAAAKQTQALGALESRIVGVVMRALRGILQHMDERALLEQALRRVAAALKGDRFVVLRVCPRQESAARAALQAVVQELGAPDLVEVRADAALQPGACIVESDSAVVDASLEPQLAAIERALRANFASKDDAVCK